MRAPTLAHRPLYRAAGRLCVPSRWRAVRYRYTACREAAPSGRAGRSSLGERAGFHGSDVVASEIRPPRSERDSLVTMTSTEISHARRRRRGRAKPRSSGRAAAPTRSAQGARAPHDRAWEAGPASGMAGVATLHASFAELGVPGPLVDALAGAGLTVPFPIQAATLPDALAGRDILGRGRTGSGKT